jgi:hypothetical protein
MGLLDGYFDPQQFGEGGGLLGRLLALQQQQSQYQPAPPQTSAPQAPERGMAWPGLPHYDPAPFSLWNAAQNLPAQYTAGAAASRPHSPTPNSNQGDIQEVGVTSDQSSYCRTMKRLCHSQCVQLALAPDGFGPYRACMRTCMHNAGCFDF